MSAYACEPNRGSEPGVGWNWAVSMAKYHEVTVLTRSNNEPVISKWLSEHCEERLNLHFIYHDLPRWILSLKRSRFLPVQIFYVLWQLTVRIRMASKLRRFDLIHHITFNSLMLPGFWWFSPRPVVLGPLGGTSCVASCFKSLHPASFKKETVRAALIRSWFLLPWVRMSFRQASAILCANSQTRGLINPVYAKKTRLMLETGVTESDIIAAVENDDKIVRFVWAGAIEPWKALPIAIHSFHRAVQLLGDRVEIVLDVIGDGSQAEAAKKLCESLDVAEQVNFHGWVSKRRVSELFRCSRALLFTSVKDTSGNVVLESMLQGLAVVCFDHQGVADITSDETAIRVSPQGVTGAWGEFAHAICLLSENKAVAKRYGEAGQKRVLNDYSWVKKSREMACIYQSVYDSSL